MKKTKLFFILCFISILILLFTVTTGCSLLSDLEDLLGVLEDDETDDIIDNYPPSLPLSLSPNNGAVDVSINSTLSWECNDPENDPLTYDVYFGISSNPQMANSNQSETTFNPGTLNNDEKYYWKIVAKDDHVNSTSSIVWSFTTNELPPDSFEQGILVFTSFENDPEGDIYTMKLDGTDLTNISNDSDVISREPCWSDDGQRIAWYGGPGGGAGIYVANRDGSNINIYGSDNRVSPDFSPDGSKIAYCLVSGEKLMTMTDTGGSITDLETTGSFPDWSPDGTKILYTCWASSTVGELSILDIGTGLSELIRSTPGFEDESAQWSPDGNKIVFRSNKSGNSDIWVVNSDGTNFQNLTIDWVDSGEGSPTWSPDGNYIAFTSDVSGNSDIWIMEADGSNSYNLTNTTWNESRPDWVVGDVGLVAYYPFNGNANDGSGNGNNGTVYGATLTSDRFGNPSSAYDFDGTDDYIYVPSDGGLSFDASSQSYTISLFFFVDSFNNAIGGNLDLIKDREIGINTWTSYGISVLAEPHHPEKIKYLHSGIWKTGYSYNVLSSYIMEANQWYHVAIVVKAGQTLSLYINGQYNNFISLEGITNTKGNTGGITIGAGYYPAGPYVPEGLQIFNGIIDEVRMYNRALTEEEIEVLYHEGGWGD